MGAFDAIKINKADNTATVLRDIKAGDEVRVSAEGTILSVIAQQDIAFGHKIALSEMQPGTSLLKYGEVMGTLPKIFTAESLCMCIMPTAIVGGGTFMAIAMLCNHRE